ncbi:MAG: type I-E CRISPR-associated protein Cas6/Cse3/CasE [Thiolinea sp.]
MRQLRQGIYREHQMIWDLLPRDPEQARDFLYRREDSQNWPFYYLLSERKPEDSRDFLQVSTQLYNPQLRTGDALYFSLRANAVISRKADDVSKRRIRRDIVEARIDEYRAQEPDSSLWPPKAYIHQEAGEAWLRRQGEKLGFQVESLSVQNHQYHQFYKPGDRQDNNQRQFSSLDFSGVLRVTDARLFVEGALFSGIGRAKAYGCGLLLVKRT